MRNLRHRYTYKARLEFQDVTLALRSYLLPLLLKRQGGVCALCKVVAERYELDHKLYNPMSTLEHLQALCHACHASITNYISFKNRSVERSAL